MYQALLNRMLTVTTWRTSLTLERARLSQAKRGAYKSCSEPAYIVEGPIPLVDEAVDIEALFCVVPRAFAQVAR